MYFIMSDNRLIINLSSYLIVAFDFFRNERDDFEFKKNLLLELESKSFWKRKQHENIKNDLVFMNVYVDMIWFTFVNHKKDE